jgi:serine/threonine protein kinase
VSGWPTRWRYELDAHLCVISLYSLYPLRSARTGSYGAVYIATHRLTGTRCAVKKIPKSMTGQLTREIHHHRSLHHRHILQLYEIIATESHIWLVSELCTGGELFDYLVERGRLLEGEARRIFGELTVAVGTIHRKGTVHRDLKLENVFLNGFCGVKLGDLGFAREWSRGSKLLDTFCGTTGYASPEMLQGHKYAGEGEQIRRQEAGSRWLGS